MLSAMFFIVMPSIIMLSVVMLRVVMVSVIMLSVFMFSVMAPCVVVALASKLNQVEKRASADELTKTYNKNIFFYKSYYKTLMMRRREKTAPRHSV
jgi:hypothetical protein